MESADKPPWCGISGVTWHNGKLYLASDESFSDAERSPVFALSLDTKTYILGPTHYLRDPLLSQARKWEDLTVFPDGTQMGMLTAFDRIAADNSQNGFNIFAHLPLPAGKRPARLLDLARNSVIAPKGEYSRALREGMRKLLANAQFPQGPPFFKMEGLAAIPGDQLVFGVRSQGVNYENFEYQVKLVSLSYKYSDDGIILGDDLRLIADFGGLARQVLGTPVGLAGLAWNPADNHLYILTSREPEERLGGLDSWIWRFSIADWQAGRRPEIGMTPDNVPFHFGFKAEGLTFFAPGRAFAIMDEDKSQSMMETAAGWKQRQRHQAPYFVLDIASGNR